MPSSDSDPDLIRCPQCDQQAGRLLLEISRRARVNYFQCDRCSCVWNVQKHSARDASRVNGVRATGA